MQKVDSVPISRGIDKLMKQLTFVSVTLFVDLLQSISGTAAEKQRTLILCRMIHTFNHGRVVANVVRVCRPRYRVVFFAGVLSGY
jgi:hypothetical protein